MAYFASLKGCRVAQILTVPRFLQYLFNRLTDGAGELYFRNVTNYKGHSRSFRVPGNKLSLLVGLVLFDKFAVLQVPV